MRWLFAPSGRLLFEWSPILQNPNKCPVDGVLVMGSLVENDYRYGPEYVKAFVTQSYCGVYGRPQGIPGLMPFIGTTQLSDWFDSARWAKAAKFIEQTLQNDRRFCIDFEPYWTTGARYPGTDTILTFLKASMPFIDCLRANNVKLYALPGIHYMATLAWANACRAKGVGEVIALDEACYNFALPDKRDAATWVRSITSRKEATEEMGFEWWPGLYYPGLKDQELLSISANQWFFLRPEDVAEFKAL